MLAKNLHKVLSLHACMVCEIFLHISLFSCNAVVLNAQLWVFNNSSCDQTRFECMQRAKFKTRYRFPLHAQENGSLSSKLDFGFLLNSDPYFYKIQPLPLQSKSWLGTCACFVVKVGLPNFSAFHFILRNTFNLFSINLIAIYLFHPLFIINLT